MASTTPGNDDRRWAWTPFVIKLVVALVIATPFIAIILQALGKR